MILQHKFAARNYHISIHFSDKSVVTGYHQESKEL